MSTSRKSSPCVFFFQIWSTLEVTLGLCLKTSSYRLQALQISRGAVSWDFISLEAYNPSKHFRELLAFFLRVFMKVLGIAVQGLNLQSLVLLDYIHVRQKNNNNKLHWSLCTHHRTLVCIHYYIFHYLKQVSIQIGLITFFPSPNIQLYHKRIGLTSTQNFLSAYVL